MGSTPIGISASRGAALLGLSQYQTPFDVWSQIVEERNPGTLARLGIEPPEKPDNAAIRWGSAFEDAICALASRKRGLKIMDRERLHVLNVLSVPITCHIDGRYTDGVLHEGKTTSSFAFHDAWGTPGTDRIPLVYQVQVQHQMLATKDETVVISTLVFPTRPEEWEEDGLRIETGSDLIVRSDGIHLSIAGTCETWASMLDEMGFFHQHTVAADRELQADLEERYTDFWDTYVVTETPPPAELWSDVKRLYPSPRGTVVATEEQESLAQTYAQINSEIASAKKSQEAIKVRLMGAIERGAEHPIDNDSVEAIVLRDRKGRKIASYAKEKSGKLVFRCGG